MLPIAYVLHVLYTLNTNFNYPLSIEHWPSPGVVTVNESNKSYSVQNIHNVRLYTMLKQSSLRPNFFILPIYKLFTNYLCGVV